MSNKSSAWANLGAGIIMDNDTLDAPVGNGPILAVGKHQDLTITEVELEESKAGNPMIVVRLENEAGAGVTNYVTMNAVTQKKGPNKGQLGFGFKFKALCSCLLPSKTAEQAQRKNDFFITGALNNPDMFKSIIGMKVSILMKEGDDGYEIQDDGAGGKQMVDCITKKVIDGTGVYADFQEVKEKGKELGIYQRKNELDRLLPPSEEGQKINEDAVDKVLGGVKEEPKAATKKGFVSL